jgi:hypothetical protein
MAGMALETATHLTTLEAKRGRKYNIYLTGLTPRARAAFVRGAPPRASRPARHSDGCPLYPWRHALLTVLRSLHPYQHTP